jgi:O-antigen/teichoic acid export membrane protein
MIVPEIFMLIFLPLITRNYASKRTSTIKELSQQVGKWIFVINLPLFILLLLFPGSAINILFGSAYLAAVPALRLLSIGIFVQSIFVVPTYLISMIGKSKISLINIVLATILNVILNSILIPLPKVWFLDNSNGLIGAATATIISIIFLSTLFMFQTYYYLSIIPFRRKIFRILIIGAILSGALLIVHNLLVNPGIILLGLLATAFLGVYFITAYVVGGLDKNDISVISDILNTILRRKSLDVKNA